MSTLTNSTKPQICSELKLPISKTGNGYTGSNIYCLYNNLQEIEIRSIWYFCRSYKQIKSCKLHYRDISTKFDMASVVLFSFLRTRQTVRPTASPTCNATFLARSGPWCHNKLPQEERQHRRPHPAPPGSTAPSTQEPCGCDDQDQIRINVSISGWDKDGKIWWQSLRSRNDQMKMMIELYTFKNLVLY